MNKKEKIFVYKRNKETNDWEQCEFENIKKGDVFRCSEVNIGDSSAKMADITFEAKVDAFIGEDGAWAIDGDLIRPVGSNLN
jgi:hypothetical protein